MKITVFTPTYNRSYIISQLYQSLLAQTYHDFEWLVIDDGSNDSTQDLFHKLISENKIDIRYYKVPNGGKHRAINRGSDLARGEIFFIVDSDDYLTPNSLERVHYWFGEIQKKKAKFAGISGLKGYTPQNYIGTTFQGKHLELFSPQQKQYGISGDRADAFYTSVLRTFKFPEFPGENFLTEATLWFKIAEHGYKTCFFNEIICICNYLPDGLTHNSVATRLKNIHGTLFAYRYLVTVKQLPFSLRLRYFLNYWRFYLFSFFYHNSAI